MTKGRKNKFISVIFQKVDDFFYTTDFANSEYAASGITKVIHPFKIITIQKLDPALFLVYTGDE